MPLINVATSLDIGLAQAAPLFTNAGLAAAGAAAVSIPIIIHLLTRMRRRPQRWGAMKFLLEAYRRHRTRLRLEQWLLLLLRCLILLLLGLALAGPMLGGCAQNLGVDATGRTVYLVIDDSLSEAAKADGDDDDEQRFERQRKLALQLIDSLDAADRVSLVLAARPAEAVISPPALDRRGATRRIEQLEPRASRADLVTALKLVKDDLAERQPPADRAFVVVLSDFARDAAPVDQPVPDELADLSDHARLLLTRPMPDAANVQLASLKPRRHMVLTGAAASMTANQAVRVPIEIKLRRFADSDPSRVTNIELSLLAGDASQPVAVFEPISHRWEPDATEATLRTDLMLTAEMLEGIRLAQTNDGGSPGATATPGASGPTTTGGGAGGGSVIIRAKIEPDALAADNERFAAIELRQKLRVGIVGDATGTGESRASRDGEFTALDWLSFVLTPNEQAKTLIDVSNLAAIDADGEKLDQLDAALVLRPDQLSDAGWRGLRRLADRGGVVWLFAPAADTPAQWAETMQTRLGVNWQVGLDAESLVPEDAVDAAAPPDADASSRRAPGLGLDIDRPEPELLRVLAADWKDLLRPVRVKRRLPASAPAGDAQIWLATEDGKPLLLHAEMGDGRVLLQTAALDLEWTNLPTKPLFVPLVHELLRSAAAQSAAAAQVAGAVVGDQPTLGSAWEGVTQLERLGGGAGAANGAADDDDTLLLRRDDAGLSPVRAFTQPGVYRAAPEARGRVIPVNVDPIAGDTRAAEPTQLDGWLARLGETTWLDEDEPAAAFAKFTARVNIGMTLLWVTLALVLIELLLARLFSHAGAEKPGVGAMLVNRFVGRIKERA